MNVKEKIKAIEGILRIEEQNYMRGGGEYIGTFQSTYSKSNIIDFLLDTCFCLETKNGNLETIVKKLNKKIELLEKYLEIEVKEIPSETKYTKKGE
jgi:hypothetical protein